MDIDSHVYHIVKKSGKQYVQYGFSFDLKSLCVYTHICIEKIAKYINKIVYLGEECQIVLNFVLFCFLSFLVLCET